MQEACWGLNPEVGAFFISQVLGNKGRFWIEKYHDRDRMAYRETTLLQAEEMSAIITCAPSL